MAEPYRRQYGLGMEHVPERARDAGGPALTDGETRFAGDGLRAETAIGQPPDPSTVSGLSQAHADVIERLISMFETRKDDLDLALMKVIAEGGSPAEWLSGMLRASIPPELAESSPKPRFLGE
jgi:hypothetical protein